jgi:hypothetical protein
MDATEKTTIKVTTSDSPRQSSMISPERLDQTAGTLARLPKDDGSQVLSPETDNK